MNAIAIPLTPKNHAKTSLREYRYDPEDVPVTFQVALVGTDGIVVASDKKVIWKSEIMRGGLTSKLLVDKESGTVFDLAGHDISRTIAMRLIQQPKIFDSEDPSIAVATLAQRVYEDVFPDSRGMGGADCELIAVSQKHLNRIFYFVMNNRQCQPTPLEDKAVAGHTNNSAIFFVEHFYRPRPISELTLLAAHAVLIASNRNPAGIEGLEIVTCRDDEIRKLSDAEIRLLTAESGKLDESIGQSLSREILEPH